MAESKSTISTRVMIIIVLAIAFTGGYLVARERYKPQIKELSSMVIDRDDKITYLNNLRNRLYVKDGELMQNKDGQVITITETVILTDGSKVNPKGEIVRANGEKENLKGGEILFMDGTVVGEEEFEIMNSTDK